MTRLKLVVSDAVREKWNEWAEGDRRRVLESCDLPTGYGCWKWHELPEFVQTALRENARSK